MLRERYIKMRIKGVYDTSWFFEYYKSEGGKMNNFAEFEDYFNYETIKVHGYVMGKNQRNHAETLEFLDKKLGLHLLLDKDGKLIKIIE